jgi:hypothetical protein
MDDVHPRNPGGTMLGYVTVPELGPFIEPKSSLRLPNPHIEYFSFIIFMKVHNVFLF